MVCKMSIMLIFVTIINFITVCINLTNIWNHMNNLELT